MKLDETSAKFAVIKTAFHGGGALSFHNSLSAAYKSASKYRGHTCECGCCAVVPVTKEAMNKMMVYGEPMLYSDYPEYDTNISNPYTLCR